MNAAPRDRQGRLKRRSGRWLIRFRESYLYSNPLCAHCLAKGRVTAATEVDHIQAITNGGKDFDVDPSNAQGLCDDCHALKTAADLGYTVKPKIGLDGFPIE